MLFKHTCKTCGKEFESTGKAQFCSHLCTKVARTHKAFPDGSEYVQCKECGFRAKQLIQHVEKVHGIKVEEYCEKYNCTRHDLSTDALHKQMSEGVLKANSEGRCGWQKGGKNPSKTEDVKNGRKSIFSKNYKGYDGLSDEEKEKRIHEACQKNVKIMNENGNNPLRVDYYIKRGYSEEEARKILAERQCTFSLQTCIEKYGKEEGTKIFNARQEKWQNTLNSKSEEEIKRINKLKASQASNICAYSNISQKLFNSIYNIIKNEYKEIYFATHKTVENDNKNYEYEVVLDDQTHRYFLDFYVKDNNKIIEFDGDYWHSEKRGNQLRDNLREQTLKNMGFTNILHVKERDYKANPDSVVQQCVAFIRKN